MPNRKRGGLITTANITLKQKASARHLRRKAEKLAKKHPSEVNQALARLDERARKLAEKKDENKRR